MRCGVTSLTGGREHALLGLAPLCALRRSHPHTGADPSPPPDATRRPTPSCVFGQQGHVPRARGWDGFVARCEVTYTGRLNRVPSGGGRLLVFKADGSVLVHADAGGYKPLNWMTPPTVVENGEAMIVVRKRAGRSEDRLEIRIAELLAEFEHELGEDAGLEKDGVERHLQEALADVPGGDRAGPPPRPAGMADRRRAGRPHVPRRRRRLGRGRDQARRDDRGRRAALAVPRGDPARHCARRCRGILAAETIKPQAATLCDARGLGWVEVDLATLRGEREPELTLFERLRAHGRTAALR